MLLLPSPSICAPFGEDLAPGARGRKPAFSTPPWRRALRGGAASMKRGGRRLPRLPTPSPIPPAPAPRGRAPGLFSCAALFGCPLPWRVRGGGPRYPYHPAAVAGRARQAGREHMAQATPRGLAADQPLRTGPPQWWQVGPACWACRAPPPLLRKNPTVMGVLILRRWASKKRLSWYTVIACSVSPGGCRSSACPPGEPLGQAGDTPSHRRDHGTGVVPLAPPPEKERYSVVPPPGAGPLTPLPGGGFFLFWRRLTPSPAPSPEEERWRGGDLSALAGHPHLMGSAQAPASCPGRAGTASPQSLQPWGDSTLPPGSRGAAPSHCPLDAG